MEIFIRKIFKKYLTLLIFLSVVLFSANVFGENLAKVSSQKMKLDGENVSMAAYNINGNNYFKLRDLAAILDGKACTFNIAFDEGSASVLIKKNESYKKSEDDLKNLGYNKAYIESSQKILLDGEKINTKAYLIGVNNFFKLRDLGKTIGFYVGYDQGENSIIIDTSKAYVEEKSGKEEKTTKEEETFGNLANQAGENGKISFENKRLLDFHLRFLQFQMRQILNFR
ncbi:hypothetical protein [uncultured Peptoniphilus sp.]|uniref:hypothetical protein n=1 Tax=uncultured Peptoniphilus sp. TaxID=254354 RepID=UPI0028052904|nr:hypothetical protein [uncultured Peptoniphilus sp.]